MSDSSVSTLRQRVLERVNKENWYLGSNEALYDLLAEAWPVRELRLEILHRIADWDDERKALFRECIESRIETITCNVSADISKLVESFEEAGKQAAEACDAMEDAIRKRYKDALEPEVDTKNLKEYALYQNYQSFLKDYIEPDLNSQLKLDDLYRAFQRWEDSMPNKPRTAELFHGSSLTLAEWMLRKFIFKVHVDGATFPGLKLKDVDPGAK